MRSRAHLLAVLSFVFALLAAPFANAASEARTPDDLEELVNAAQEIPGFDAALAPADAAFEARSWQKAAELYERASTMAKDEIAYPLRRRCEALTELRQRDAALRACKSMQNAKVSDAADLSALVGALMLGDGAATRTDLEMAKFLSRRIEGLDPDSVFSLAARCEVARRVGDGAALSACSKKLFELAPEHRLTRRFLASAHGGERSGTLKLLLFASLLIAIIATLAHRFFRPRRATHASTAVAAAMCLLCAAPFARAQAIGIIEEPADPNAPAYSGPPTKADLEHDGEVSAFKDEMKQLNELMDQINQAEDFITKKNDWPSGIKIYNQVITTIPYFVKGWRRLCEGYAALNLFEEGEHACRQVLASKEATAYDRALLVHHLLSGSKGKDPATRAEAKQLASDAVAAAPEERWGYDAQCEVAVLQKDRPALAACSKKLEQLAPDDRKTLAFAWSLAVTDQRYDDAARLIEDAKKRGLDEGTAKRMQRELESRLPLETRLKRRAPIGIAAGLVAAVAVMLVGRLVRRRRTTTAPLAS